MVNILGKLRRFVSSRLDIESLSFFRNSAWLFGDQTVRAAMVFARSIVLARGLGPELFGGYTVAIALVATVQEFLNLNLGSAVIKYGAEFRESGQSHKLSALVKAGYLFTAALILLSIGAVALVLEIGYETFLEVPGLEPFIILLALGTGLALFDELGKALLRLYDCFRLNALVNMGASVFELGAIVGVVIVFPGRVDYVILALAAVRGITAFAVTLAVVFELRGRLGNVLKPGWGDIRRISVETWRFVIGTSGSNSIRRLIRRGDVLFLGALVGPAQVGFYAIAKKLASTVLVAVGPMAHSIYPQLAAMVARQRYHDLKQMLFNVMQLISGPLAAGIFLLLLFGKQFIGLAYGDEYLAAHVILVWIVVAMSVDAVFFWTVSLLNSLDLVAVRFKVYAVAAVIGVVVAYVLVPVLGGAGMAMALLVVNLLTHLWFASVNLRKVTELSLAH